MFRGSCENDRSGHLLHRGSAVERVGDQIFLFGKNVFRADYIPEFCEPVFSQYHKRFLRMSGEWQRGQA
jgi:hypothetical protein